MKKNFWFDLDERVIVITGGAGLLGQEHAKAVISCGATAVIADLNLDIAKQTAEKLGDNAYAIELDITSDVSIKKSIDEILNRFARIDALINNAAINPKVNQDGIESTRLENYSFDHLVHEMNVNLIGAIATSRTYGEYFAKKSRGNILNISSDLGLVAPDQRLYAKPGVDEFSQPVKPVTYAVAKAGLIGLTRYLSTYWAHRNVRVNAICPGGVKVDQDEVFLRKIEKLIPLGRLASREEYQALVAFLCSDSSGYITGAVISADGGRTAW